MMSLRVPAALSVSDRPEALVQSVWMVLFPQLDSVPNVASTITDEGLHKVTLVVNKVQLEFGCFEDALKFAESAGYQVSTFTLMEHRESFWYEQAYPVSEDYFWNRFQAEAIQ